MVIISLQVLAELTDNLLPIKCEATTGVGVGVNVGVGVVVCVGVILGVIVGVIVGVGVLVGVVVCVGVIVGVILGVGVGVMLNVCPTSQLSSSIILTTKSPLSYGSGTWNE